MNSACQQLGSRILHRSRSCSELWGLILPRSRPASISVEVIERTYMSTVIIRVNYDKGTFVEWCAKMALFNEENYENSIIYDPHCQEAPMHAHLCPKSHIRVTFPYQQAGVGTNEKLTQPLNEQRRRSNPHSESFV